MFYASIVFEIFAYKYDFFVQLVQSILKYNRGIYMQNVLLRLREVQPSLSSTERQIAQFILDNPDETTTLTIRDLARRSFSSPSSVVRICRVIGFQGYKELRHALTLELATLGENGSHREKDITPQDSLQEIVDKVTHKNIQSLLDTQRLLLLDELEQCVELIANDRSGGDQGDAAVLDTFQQALLLLFVQVLDLVQIQQNAARRCQRADILEHCLDIPGAAGGAVELVQGHAAVLGNDACHRGISGAGGTVKDHVGDASALDGAAEHPPRSQQMLLPAHIRQRFGTQALRKWFIHGGFPFPARKALFI